MIIWLSKRLIITDYTWAEFSSGLTGSGASKLQTFLVIERRLVTKQHINDKDNKLWIICHTLLIVQLSSRCPIGETSCRRYILRWFLKTTYYWYHSFDRGRTRCKLCYRTMKLIASLLSSKYTPKCTNYWVLQSKHFKSLGSTYLVAHRPTYISTNYRYPQLVLVFSYDLQLYQ